MDIIIFLSGVVFGASAMFLSFRRSQIAVDHERKRAEKREERLRDQRDAHTVAEEQAKEELVQLRIEQANSAGYVDGYNACLQENGLDAVQGILDKGLRDGKRIVCSVFNR